MRRSRPTRCCVPFKAGWNEKKIITDKSDNGVLNRCQKALVLSMPTLFAPSFISTLRDCHENFRLVSVTTDCGLACCVAVYTSYRNIALLEEKHDRVLGEQLFLPFFCCHHGVSLWTNL